MMELKDLVGEHVLDAVDFSDETVRGWGGAYEACQVMCFRLDGVVYTATEDPDDGYRSCMRDLVIGHGPMKNIFDACKVIARHRDDNADILELIDAKTGGVIVEVGTDNSDDYYPYFVARFDPTAMASNAT